MHKKLLIFPFGGNAREALLCVFAINRQKHTWDVLGFLDDDTSLQDKICCGVRVIGQRELMLSAMETYVLAVPGNPDSFLQRPRIIESLHLTRRNFTTIIHPSVDISPDAGIGCNCLIMANTVISAGVQIGDHCIILPNTFIAHDVTIGDYCCIGANVTVSSNVCIMNNCYIGSGVSIKEKLSIGSKTFAGLGSNIVKNIGDNLVVAGNPARTLHQ
jgi:sugar O-acyltransferase (sialic acid O-acetyltransferase NeuD family)